MKKYSISLIAIIFASTTIMAKLPAPKRTAKQQVCKCSKEKCSNGARCSK